MTTDIYHVMPMGDLREHESSAACWCKPVQHEQITNVYVHTSMDGREAFETGERRPS